ncbi:hypothetical protein [Leuconostoc citreum]
MHIEQLSLFQHDELRDESENQRYMVLVSKLHSHYLDSYMIRAVITDKQVRDNIKNQVLRDQYGHEYVGRKSVKWARNDDFNNCLRLMPTNNSLNHVLGFKVDPVKKLLAEKRRKHYAN